MGRIERPLSAAPHEGRCCQMDASFSDYIIERRLCRASRTIGWGCSAETGAGYASFPGTMDDIHPPGDGAGNAFPVESTGVTNMHSAGKSGGAARCEFPVEFPGKGGPVEMRPRPWILYTQSGDFPGNSPAAQPSSRGISRWFPGESHGQFPGYREPPGNFPDNGCRCQNSWRRGGDLNGRSLPF